MGHQKQSEQRPQTGRSHPLVASGAKVMIMLLFILLLVDVIFLPPPDVIGRPIRSGLGNVVHLLPDPVYLFKESLISVSGGLLYMMVLCQKKLAKE